MKVKFNKFERIAGLFVVGAMGCFALSLIGVAVKQGWFDSKVTYTTIFKAADGLHPGAMVQIAGLKAGSVDEVDLTNDNHVFVKFTVLAKFSKRIKTDSVAQLVRPFVIGDRVLEVSVGSPEAQVLPPETAVTSHDTIDLMGLLSGRNLGESLEAMSEMMGNFKDLASAFLDKNRTQNFVQMIDRLDPLLKNLNTMSVEVIKLSKQATKNDNFGTVMAELSTTTRELNQLIPMMNEKAPKMAGDMEKLVSNLSVLTEQFKVFIPALAEIGPDLPHASRRAVQALDEAVVLLKSMQKSWFLRGNSREVREEEAKAEAEAKAKKERAPASEPGN